jgi:hypothetical protein
MKCFQSLADMLRKREVSERISSEKRVLARDQISLLFLMAVRQLHFHRIPFVIIAFGLVALGSISI